jgi:hypothetical protein
MTTTAKTVGQHEEAEFQEIRDDLATTAASLYTLSKMYAVHYEAVHFDPGNDMPPVFLQIGVKLAKAAEALRLVDERIQAHEEKYGEDERPEYGAPGGYM